MIIQGVIIALRKNNKGIKIKDDWYSFFKENKEFKINDEVKLDYKLNGKFKNIKKINLLFRKSESKLEPEIKEESEQPKPKPKLDTTTLNTILMCAKDIKCTYVKINIPRQFKDIVKEIMEGLKELNTYLDLRD